MRLTQCLSRRHVIGGSPARGRAGRCCGRYSHGSERRGCSDLVCSCQRLCFERGSMPHSLGGGARRSLTFTKHRRTFLPSLALAALLAGMSGCGWHPASSQTGPSHAPDRMQMAIHFLYPKVAQPSQTPPPTPLSPPLTTTLLTLSRLP